ETVTTSIDTKGRKQPAKHRARRRGREQKKQADFIEENRRRYQPAVEALAARLVELDPKVARGVLSAVALRGPSRTPEGPNFIPALPFAFGPEAALNALGEQDIDPPEASTEAMKAKLAAPVNDQTAPGPIPECLRRSAQ